MDAAEQIAEIAHKPERLVLGLMSGMSMDGLDLALVRIHGHAERTPVDLVASDTVPYDEDLARRLHEARGLREAPDLDVELGKRWALEVLSFLDRAGVGTEQVDFLGSHGQTLFHCERHGRGPAASLQIGHGDVLRDFTGIPTVCDFRQADIRAGGEGAPLVPLADWILYGGDEVTACHNLGSIANTTVLAPDLADVIAFDTGPANMLIDAFARRCPGAPSMDRDGRLSARGHVHRELSVMLMLNTHSFVDQKPPKSLGYGRFGPGLIEVVTAYVPGVDHFDCVRTAVEFTAQTIRAAYEKWVLPRFSGLRRVRFSGGGCRNPTLMAAIREHLDPIGLVVETLSDQWADAKEAVAFALLADRTVRGLPGNVPGATGASAAVVLGTIHA